MRKGTKIKIVEVKIAEPGTRALDGKAMIGAVQTILYTKVAAVPELYTFAFADLQSGTCVSCKATAGFDLLRGDGEPQSSVACLRYWPRTERPHAKASGQPLERVAGRFHLSEAREDGSDTASANISRKTSAVGTHSPRIAHALA